MSTNCKKNNQMPGHYLERILVGIPVHGDSMQLKNTLCSISRVAAREQKLIHVVIVNSGKDLNVAEFNKVDITIITVGNTNYWTGSVSYIYEYFLTQNFPFLLLMNHDCHLSNQCIRNLVNAAMVNLNSVCHALLLYKSTATVWWAGTKRNKLSRGKSLYENLHYKQIPKFPYATDSTMGQCLLLPRAAVNTKYLHLNKLPHYFSDSVQTCEMRRQGFKLLIVPSAVAYTDQSDHFSKLKRLQPTSFAKMVDSWISPWSSRNLRASWYASYYHHDDILSKMLMPIYMVIGKVAVNIHDYLSYLWRK